MAPLFVTPLIVSFLAVRSAGSIPAVRFFSASAVRGACWLVTPEPVLLR